MDERVVEALGYSYCYLSDDELDLELIRLTNDSYLCRSEEELNNVHYYERHKAIWSELRKRGLTTKAGESDCPKT